MQNELAGKNSLINALKGKIEGIEGVRRSYKEDLNDENSKISILEMQLEELEKRQKSDKQVRDKKIKDIEMNIKRKTKQQHSEGNFKCLE